MLPRRASAMVRTFVQNEVARPLLEPILHPSRWRIRWLGMTTFVGHPLFYWIWGYLLPQPYENLAQRLIMSGLGFSLLTSKAFAATPPSRLAAATFTVVFWISLPFFFSWMYLCNGCNTVWLATECMMFLIYYHLTDWRIATVGAPTGALAAWLVFRAFGPQVPPLTPEHIYTDAVVIAFSVYMGLMLGLSSSNLRREHLNYTLGTMGIMAHELRTPLATMSLIGDAIRPDPGHSDDPDAQRLDELSRRLHLLVRSMNHQIDTQIANARLLHLPAQTDMIWAGEVVRKAVADYPYRSSRERESVTAVVKEDFRFQGSEALFTQVLDNMLKNGLRSLAASNRVSQRGDLDIEVGTARGRGRIVVTDRGVGIDPALQGSIFAPFFSTDHGTGHGLGLAFCQRVVHSAHGTIRVKSEPGHGASFTIELPLSS
jgi:two-component system CAI-1 autoinducer sensor kinase/phosphatase CqsS